jgi:hypothetical protein
VYFFSGIFFFLPLLKYRPEKNIVGVGFVGGKVPCRTTRYFFLGQDKNKKEGRELTLKESKQI